MDDSDHIGGGFTNPFYLRSDSLTGDRQFNLVNTRDVAGLPVWTAPQGATVAGGCPTVMAVVTCKKYVFDWDDFNVMKTDTVDRIGSILTRSFQTGSTDEDTPTAGGVTLTDPLGDYDVPADGGAPLMAVLGEPLVAMVQNLGQTDNSFLLLGAANTKVLSQGFTTGADAFGYRLQGIGINIEGSDDSNSVPQVPDNPTSVSVAVYTDSNGKPGTKLFDLVSPTEYAPGHSFFEAPPGTVLAPNTSYVLVWRHNSGTWHRLQRTSSDAEDPGARTDSGIANSSYRGADPSSLSVVSGSNVLEFAVYTVVKGQPPIWVPLGWSHMPDGAYPGYQFRALFVTHHATLPTSADKEVYDDLVQFEAAGRSKRYPETARPVHRCGHSGICLGVQGGGLHRRGQ